MNRNSRQSAVETLATELCSEGDLQPKQKPRQTSTFRANLVKRRRIWAVTSAGVILLVLSGTLVGVNYLNGQAEFLATAGGNTEKDDVQALKQPEIVPPSPAPSPIAHIPSTTPPPIAVIPEAPRIGTSPPTATPPAGRPGTGDHDAEIQLPGLNPEPGTPGGDGPGEAGSGPDLGAPAPPAEIVLGQTIDEVGDPHTLVLNVADNAAGALLHTDEVFAVISGGSRFSVTGDVAVDSWRFTVDSAAPEPNAPIVVIKSATGRSMHELAAFPHLYTSAGALNEDPVETSTRLTALISEVISKAEPSSSNSSFYLLLAQQLVDPLWRGVMIFNASATVPVEVLGQSTGVLADSQVSVLNMGFETPSMSSVPTPSTVFGIIDQAQDSGDALPPGVQYLRARFSNSALTAFDQG